MSQGGDGRARRKDRLVRALAAAVLVAGIPLTAGSPAGAEVLPATWVAQGPGPTEDGQVEGASIVDGLVTGAVHTVVAHPTNADILWIGAVGGGIWRTNNATNASPTWVPQTDQQPGLSMGALELDPTDASNNTLVAGVGRFSAFGGRGGPRTGALRTTNGGTNWTALGSAGLVGENISGIAPRGATIVASSNGGAQGGIFRSTDTGASFTRLSGNGTSGLPGGIAFDLASDPGNPARLYASIVGVNAGVYRSDDTGATWANVSGTNFGGAAPPGNITANTTNMEIAVHNNAGNNVVYVGVINDLLVPNPGNDQLVGLFRSTNQGAAWTAMVVPTTNEGGVPIGLQPVRTIPREPGGQGSVHFSIRPDPTDATVVYLGGDRQPLGAGPDGIGGNNDDNFPNSIGAQDFTGRLFRCDSAPAGCAHITHTNANGSSPHADSRDIVFDANGDMIEVDDGGVYRQTNPAANTGSWVSVIGDLQVAETHACRWDRVADVILCGNQDTGTPWQLATGSLTWDSTTTADGGIPLVDDSADPSTRYDSANRLGGFRRRTCNAANVCAAPVNAALVVAGTGGMTYRQVEGTPPLYPPVAMNAITPARLIIAGVTNLYETANQGDLLTDLGNVGGATRAIAYGGAGNANAIWYGAGNGLRLRTGAAGSGAAVAAYPGGAVQDVVMDTDDWNTAYVVDADQVFRTTNTGANWTDITANLGTLARGAFRTIEFMETPGFDAIVVGTDTGVFVNQANPSGQWLELGTNLPNTVTFDLEYDAGDDVLLAGTLGRGSWTLANASQLFPSGICANPPTPATPPAGFNVVLGTAGNDNPLNGTPGNDVIFGLEGQDRIDGGGGNDIILGGPGQDQIFGGDGNDIICAGDGHDFADGQGGADVVSGDGGNDRIEGGGAVDRLFGDVLFGPVGHDTLIGGGGIDTGDGGPGNDNCQTEVFINCFP